MQEIYIRLRHFMKSQETGKERTVCLGVRSRNRSKPFFCKSDGVEFSVEGDRDAQITIQLEDDTEYEVYVDDVAVGGMKTNMSGKLVVSVELNEALPAG